MAAFTASVRDSQLDALTGKTTYTAANRFATIYNGDPQGAGTEVLSTVSGSATRPGITPSMNAASAGAAASNADIVFTTSAAGAATVNFVAIFDAATGGNLMASASVTSKSVGTGDGLKIASGNLTFSIT